MNASRLEWKVGLFVLISLVFAAVLIMKFSKSASLFTKTYELNLITSNVGGIRPGATVLMSGVQVGTVRAIDLDQSGRVVTMHAPIDARYHIYADARFTIEQAGFLGDQYIAVTPTENEGPKLKDGDTVRCEEPFNIQEVARSGAGLLRRLDQTATRLDEAVARIDRTLLAEETLSDFSAAVGNFRVVSERALATLRGVDELVQTNASPLSTAISNLVQFSSGLDQVSEELNLTVATNRTLITATMKNIQSGTLHLNGLLSDLQAGRGLAGSVLKDENLQQQFAATIGNLNLLSSNLTEHGLLWRPRTRRVNTNLWIYPGKNPFR